jgi:arylsulfatase A-like enzyme
MASRATIFSGLTETGHGYTGGGYPANPLQKIDVDTSFPVLLREAGYRNGFYGKQHVKFEESNDVALKRMFDDYKVYNGGPHFVTMKDGTKRHCDDLVGDHSVSFIDSQPKDKPFCLFMSFNIAHAVDNNHQPGFGHYPWPPSADGLYEDIDPAPPRLGDPKYFEMTPDFLQDSMNRDRWYWRWDTEEKYRLNMRAYYRMLTGMDNVIGRVRKSLSERGLAENTVIIYTADNGYYMGERGFAGKWSHYEESLRVPMIIFDPRPEVGTRGRVIPQFALNLDLPATMLDLAGVEVPGKYQGSSLVPFVKGETPASWRKDFYNEHHMNNDRIPKWRGVHGERYTYARYYEQNPVAEMLYDLKEDPDQLENLATDPARADLLKEMRARTDEYVKRYTRPEIVAAKAKLKGGKRPKK